MSNSRQSVKPSTVERKLLCGKAGVTLGRWLLYFPLSIQHCSSHLRKEWGCHQRDLRADLSSLKRPRTWEQGEMISRMPSPLWTGSLMMGVFKNDSANDIQGQGPWATLVSSGTGSFEKMQSSFALGSQLATLSGCWLPHIWVCASVQSILMTP